MTDNQMYNGSANNADNSQDTVNDNSAIYELADSVDSAIPGSKNDSHIEQATSTNFTAKVKQQVQKLKQLQLPELSSKGLLVFHSGNFGLRAALVKADKDYASIKGVVESRQVDFTRAIADIYQQLKAQHSSVPRRCVLISSNVISAKITLPVSPLKPKANHDMQELIRWEVEGSTANDNKQWLIGSILVERGYLTNSQREELVTELELRQDQGGDTALARFGDVAVEMGYLTQAQLQESFALQSKLLEIDQDAIFGYQAELAETNFDSQFSGLSDDVLIGDSDNQTEHSWLVAGIGRTLRKRWYGAFALNGLALAAFYPDNGASFSALGLRTDEDKQFLLEIHPSHLVLVEGSSKNVISIRTQARQDGNLTFDEVLNICPDNLGQLTEQLYLYSPYDAYDELSFTLAEYLNIDVRPLVQGMPTFDMPEGLNSNFLLPLIGTANHYLKLSELGRSCFILAKDKEPPLWQKLMQPKVLFTLGVSAGALAAIGFLVWMTYNLDIQQTRLVTLENQWTKESKVKTQYSKVKADYQTLADDIAKIKGEINLNDKLLNYLNNEVLPLATSVPGTMNAIADSTNAGVIIEHIQLESKSIVLEGRALKTKHANQFASQLNKLLKPLRYQVGDTDSTVAQEQSADGLFLDYKMRLEIGRLFFIEPEPVSTKQGTKKITKKGMTKSANNGNAKVKQLAQLKQRAQPKQLAQSKQPKQVMERG